MALAGLAVAHAGPGITALAPVRRRLFPRLAGLGQADHVALTFDDGPDPGSTPAFLDLLAARRLRATFFLLGSMVATAPGLAADIVDAGHEVGVHGWAHQYTILRGPRAVRDDLARATDAVAAACGTQPRFYRPPYGVLSAGALAAARAQRLTPGAVDLLGPGMGTGRDARLGLRDAGEGPRPGRHRPAARLRLHVTGGRLCRGSRRAAPAAGRLCRTRAPGRRARRAWPGSVIGAGEQAGGERALVLKWLAGWARLAPGAARAEEKPQEAFSLRPGSCG